MMGQIHSTNGDIFMYIFPILLLLSLSLHFGVILVAIDIFIIIYISIAIMDIINVYFNVNWYNVVSPK